MSVLKALLKTSLRIRTMYVILFILSLEAKLYDTIKRRAMSNTQMLSHAKKTRQA